MVLVMSVSEPRNFHLSNDASYRSTKPPNSSIYSLPRLMTSICPLPGATRAAWPRPWETAMADLGLRIDQAVLCILGLARGLLPDWQVNRQVNWTVDSVMVLLEGVQGFWLVVRVVAWLVLLAI
jgi:hypothetical protein